MTHMEFSENFETIKYLREYKRAVIPKQLAKKLNASGRTAKRIIHELRSHRTPIKFNRHKTHELNLKSQEGIFWPLSLLCLSMKQVTLLLIAVIIFCSCKKVVTDISCYQPQITRIADNTGRWIDITYNDRLQPLRMLVEHPEDGNPDYYFKYDEHHRLKELWGLYSKYDAETITEYYYTGERITSDSVLVWPKWQNGEWVPGSDHLDYKKDFYYDNKGRVIRVDINGKTEEIFTYNIQGNLIKTVLYSEETYYKVYDNQRSIYSTNSIWQFLELDYSQNNRFHTVSSLLIYPQVIDDRKGINLRWGQWKLGGLNYHGVQNVATITYKFPG